jgi:hypothetical protein
LRTVPWHGLVDFPAAEAFIELAPASVCGAVAASLAQPASAHESTTSAMLRNAAGACRAMRII